MSELFGVPDKWATSVDGSDEANIAHTQALTRLARAQAGRQELDLQQDQIAAQVMQGMGKGSTDSGGASTDPYSKLEQLGTRMIEAGAVTRGEAVLDKVTQARQRQASAEASKSRVLLAQQKEQAASMQDLYETLASATDQQSWDIAKMQWMSKHPKEPIPPQLDRYDPAVFDQLRASTKRGMEQSRLDERTAHDQASEDHNSRMEGLKAAEERGRMIRHGQRMAQRETLAANRTKAGAPTKMASKMEIQQAHDLIKQDYPEISTDTEIGSKNDPRLVSGGAVDIAEDARNLMNQNRALSYPEALQRAYMAAKQRGDFQVEEGTAPTKLGNFDIPGTGTKPKATFARPMPLPPKGQPLRDGARYVLPNGTVVRWDAKKGGGVPVGKTTPATQRSAVPLDDEEDDDAE